MLKRLLPVLILLLPAVALPAVVQAESAASGLLYERTLMQAAGRRCGLFAPDVAAALAAAQDQARGAALRAGDGPAAVAATQARALTRAQGADCRSAGLRTAAERVREAFQSYSQLYVLRFPGPRSAWRAERPSAAAPPWSLVEALPGSGGWILFGAARGAPALLDARRGAAPAAFARLVLRDPKLSAQPYLAGPPPPAISRAVLASARHPGPRARWPAGATGATLYLFPPELLARLDELDPREVAGVELVYPSAGRDRVVRAELEIGDLKAAEAFLASGRRTAPAR